MDWLLDTLITLLRGGIAFGFVIGFIATIHEFGHYIIAVMCGVRVDEFSLGVGPALWTRKKGDTEYNLRAIPILAYVRPAGMDPEEEFEPGNEPGDRSFQAKGFWAKQAILLGGSLFNFLGTAMIFFLVFWIHGQDATTIQVGNVLADRPAAQAGIKTGDVFLTFDGTKLRDSSAAVDYINARAGKTIRVELARPTQTEITEDFIQDPAQRELLTLEVVPEDRGGIGLMGIEVKPWLLAGEKPIAMGFGEALSRSTALTRAQVVRVFQGTISIFQRAFGSFEVPQEVGGPVQIIHIITKQSKYGLMPILFLTANLSVSIGVFNLLPIPALDGGRMLLLMLASFVGWVDKMRGKEPQAEPGHFQAMEEWLHILGFFFLIGIMILVTFKDIRQVLFGPSQPAEESAPKDPSPPAPSPPASPSP